MPIQSLFKQVSEQVQKADVFADVRLENQALRCKAKTASEAQAYYKISLDPDQNQNILVGIYTLDRWLNESIETDLVEHKDDIEELLADEMYELGIDKGLPITHFRDQQLQYLFQSPIALPQDQPLDSDAFVDYVSKVLLSYEATFSQLGDMVYKQTM